jgi:hypothetical protein
MFKNGHPRDAFIEFEAGPHKYTIRGDSNYLSVTTWNHTHFPPFDADAIIRKMRLDKPSSPYYGQTPAQIKAGWDKGRDEAAELGTALHAAIELYLGGAPLQPPIVGEVGGGDVGGGGVGGGDAVGGDAVGRDKGGRTHSAEAADGKLPHSALPLPPNASALPNTPAPHNASSPPCPALPLPPLASALSPNGGAWGVSPHFGAFIDAHPHLKPYRVEWMIFDEEVRLAGSIDFVNENPDGTLTIYDWKRCKEIKKTNRFGTFALTECISHLPDTNYWHYALQLNTYKTILERKYGKTVKQMMLVALHPNLPSYQVYTVPHLVEEMAELFALRRSQV